MMSKKNKYIASACVLLFVPGLPISIWLFRPDLFAVHKERLPEELYKEELKSTVVKAWNLNKFDHLKLTNGKQFDFLIYGNDDLEEYVSEGDSAQKKRNSDILIFKKTNGKMVTIRFKLY